MDADSESRQGVLIVASANLAAVKAKFAVVRNLRIKRLVEQPKPARCSEKGCRENPFFLQWKYVVLPTGARGGAAAIFRGRMREKMAKTQI